MGILRNVVAVDDYKIENIDYPIDSPFKLNMANIVIELSVNKTTGIREGLLNLSSMNINSEYMKIWKTYAPGKFLIRDFRKDIRDKFGMTPYYILRYSYEKNNEKNEMKVLLRNLIELEDETVTEDIKASIQKEYDDLTINNSHYAVIKMCHDDNTGHNWITTEKKNIDIIHNMYIGHYDDVFYDYSEIYAVEDEKDKEKNEHIENNSETEYESNKLL
jgi:hypothetical protein